MTITVETLQKVLALFNAHDLDAIMEYFTEDCTFDFPKGPDPWGQRFIGKAHPNTKLVEKTRNNIY